MERHNTLQVTRTLAISLRGLSPDVVDFLHTKKPWLDRVSQELSASRVLKEKRNYASITRQYLFFYAIPAIETISHRFFEVKLARLVEAQFWAVLAARFLDDILDDDNDAVGFENSVFLSHLAASRASTGAGSVHEYRLDGDSLWVWIR